MSRMKDILAQTERTLTLLIQYDPNAHGNDCVLLPIPTDLTMVERREMLELALTVVNQKIAESVFTAAPDEVVGTPAQAAPAIADAITTAIRDQDDALADSADTALAAATALEPVYEPYDDAPPSHNGHVIGARSNAIVADITQPKTPPKQPPKQRGSAQKSTKTPPRSGKAKGKN